MKVFDTTNLGIRMKYSKVNGKALVELWEFEDEGTLDLVEEEIRTVYEFLGQIIEAGLLKRKTIKRKLNK